MLRGNLADISGVSVRSPQIKHDRANIESLSFHVLKGVSSLGPLHRGLIDHYQCGCRAGDFQ
jgi:hypothetical protein